MIKPLLQPQQPPKRTVLTVSQLNRQAKSALESTIGSVWLSGEISNLTKAASGHWYFSLKDDSAQIRAAMFRFKTQTLRFSPREGDQVVVKGKVSLYEARGDYQLIVDYMEPAGEGDLQQRLRVLMEKLKAEGLFAPENKRPLPSLPQKIGVITSPTGAAIHDVLNVLARRCPMVPVIIYPTQVQGAQAANEIRNALATAIERNECDVLLVTRGGGSLEDLWCFNDESLARAISESPIPTVGAVGHEVDVTVAELVADMRAPTPSAAAELLVPEQDALIQRLDYLQMTLFDALEDKIQDLQTDLDIARLKLSDPATAIANSQHRLEYLKQSLVFSASQIGIEEQNELSSLAARLELHNPISKLAVHKKSLSHLTFRLKKAIDRQLENSHNQLVANATQLNLVSPLATLGRGFSIVRDKEKRVINSISQLEDNRTIDLLMKDGQAEAVVKKIDTNSPFE